MLLPYSRVYIRLQTTFIFWLTQQHFDTKVKPASILIKIDYIKGNLFILSKDGLLRPKQQPDSPMVFERSVQTRDMVWLGIWTLCFLEAAFLAKRFYARYTSDKKYIR